MKIFKSSKILIVTVLVAVLVFTPMGGVFAEEANTSPEDFVSNLEEMTGESADVNDTDNVDVDINYEDVAAAESVEISSLSDEEIVAALTENLDTEAKHDGYIIALKDSAEEGKQSAEKLGELLLDDLIVVDEPEDVLDIIDAKDIESISPNYELSAFDFPNDPPNDPRYSEQWNMQRQVGFDPSKVWQFGLAGENSAGAVKIAVVDSGVNRSHPDFGGRVSGGYDFVNDDADPSDDYGHGTAVASIIAASTNNGSNVAGIAYKSKIVPYKILDDQGKGTLLSLIYALEAIKADGTIKIVTMSLGFESTESVAYLQSYITDLANAGIVFIAAVGNSGNTRMMYPAGCNYVIGVGAIGRSGTVSQFSQRNNSVFVTAPGEGIYGLAMSGNSDLLFTGTGNGTSFAAPHVAGMAALAQGYSPGSFNITSFSNLLRASVEDKGATGYDTSYGYGTINGDKFAYSLGLRSGWYEFDNAEYYFNPSTGKAQTGWVQSGSTWYYYAPSGSGKLYTGWNKIGRSWYYFAATGEMVTGWQQIGGTWYHLTSSGAMSTGWLKSGDSWYHLKSSGAMTTGWLKSGSSWYYMKPGGAMATGWQQVGGSWYHLKSSGAMTTGWLKSGSSWYYLKSNGAMATGRVKVGSKWYQMNSSGRWVA